MSRKQRLAQAERLLKAQAHYALEFRVAGKTHEQICCEVSDRLRWYASRPGASEQNRADCKAANASLNVLNDPKGGK